MEIYISEQEIQRLEALSGKKIKRNSQGIPDIDKRDKKDLLEIGSIYQMKNLVPHQSQGVYNNNARPVIVIGKTKGNDSDVYVLTITSSLYNRIDNAQNPYIIPLDPKQYPGLGLWKAGSRCDASKIRTVSAMDIQIPRIGSIKEMYPVVFQAIKLKNLQHLLDESVDTNNYPSVQLLAEEITSLQTRIEKLNAIQKTAQEKEQKQKLAIAKSDSKNKWAAMKKNKKFDKNEIIEENNL